MTRTGKIARLPQLVREELNRRLRDGEPGEALLAWLNGHAGVVYVLREQFGGRPINKQNLSDWRLGGHRDWLRHQETLDWVRGLAEQDEELRDEGDGMEVSDRLAGLMAVELMRTAQTLIETEADPVARWPRLREVLQELAQLRRDDHRATRLRMDRADAQRLEEQRDEQAEEDHFKRQKARALAPIEARVLVPSLTELMGGSDAARKAAEFAMELRYQLPIGSLRPNPATSPATSPVKPSQGESRPAGPIASNSSDRIRPNPARAQGGNGDSVCIPHLNLGDAA